MEPVELPGKDRLSVHTRLCLWLLLGLLVLGVAGAAVFILIAHYPQEVLGVAGIWLLLYRLLGSNLPLRFRPVVEAAASFCAGASLGLLGPLLPWPSPALRLPALAIFGAFLGLCHFALQSAVASACIGTIVGAFLWQLGICDAVQAPWAHAGLLACCAIAFVLVFVFSPVAPPARERLLLPTLGALLLIEGVSNVSAVGILAPGALLEASPRPAADFARGARTGAAWLALAACGIAFQWLLIPAGPAPEQGKNGGKGGALADPLVPSGKDVEKNGGDGPILNKDAGLERHQILCLAMVAPEGTDQSHLTDHERKLVEVCRNDEFERDRVMFGGGLY